MKFKKNPYGLNKIIEFENCYFSFNNNPLLNYNQTPELALVFNDMFAIKTGKNLKSIIESSSNEKEAIENFLKLENEYGFWSSASDNDVILFLKQLND